MSGIRRLVSDDGRTVCERCAVADRPLARMRGLLGRRALARDEGLLLSPAPSVHTFFMRFAIDVVFLDVELRVLRVSPEVGPWRLASCRRAHAVLELAAGEAARRDIREGQRLRFAALERAAAVVGVSTSDRPFLNVVSFLLVRAGYEVEPAGGHAGLAALLERRRLDAVVVDVAAEEASSVAQLLGGRCADVGVVAVSDDRTAVTPFGGAVDKWGPFAALRSEIDRVAVPRTAQVAPT